jgi:hypothetical protein
MHTLMRQGRGSSIYFMAFVVFFAFPGTLNLHQEWFKEVPAAGGNAVYL